MNFDNEFDLPSSKARKHYLKYRRPELKVTGLFVFSDVSNLNKDFPNGHFDVEVVQAMESLSGQPWLNEESNRDT